MNPNSPDIMHGLRIRVTAISLILLFGILPLRGQTENYWSWSFNTPSVLLAGSVIAGGAGSSAVFYNPSLIDNDSIPTLSITARIVSLQFFHASNIAGEGIDADRFIFKVQPRFLSYVFPTGNDRIGVEASMLSPVSEEVNFIVQHFDELDLIQRTQGLEQYSGYLKYSRKYEDIYVGAGFSYKLSEKFSIGASSFVSIKSMRYEFHQEALAYQDRDSVIVEGEKIASYIASDSFEEEVRYWNLSLLFKLGAQYRTLNDRLRFGLNLSLPGIPLYGEAKVRRSDKRSNVYDNDSDAFTPNQASFYYDEDLSSTSRTPFWLAVGAQYFTRARKNFVSLSAEYFHDVDPYAVISSSKGAGSGSSDQFNSMSDYFAYTFGANSVTNLGIGFKQFISPKLFFLSGIRTDFSTADTDRPGFVIDNGSLNRIHIDKYHFSLGPVFEVNKTKVITGIQYTYGRNNGMPQIIDYAEPEEYISSLDLALAGIPDRSANARLNELAFFLGVTFNL